MQTLINASNLNNEVNKLANHVLTLLNGAEQDYQKAEDIIVKAGEILHFLLAERQLEEQQVSRINISNIKSIKSWMSNGNTNLADIYLM